jgi:hypothetical protein
MPILPQKDRLEPQNINDLKIKFLKKTNNSLTGSYVTSYSPLHESHPVEYEEIKMATTTKKFRP